MELTSHKMNIGLARQILSWKYEPPYELYNNEMNDESVSELLDNGYMAIKDGTGALVGFYCSGEAAQVPAGGKEGAYLEQAVDVGIGMHPDLTGKGNGSCFFGFVLNDLEKSSPGCIFRLTVASFNKRAIKLYENKGFRKEKEFISRNIGFVTMLKR